MRTQNLDHILQSRPMPGKKAKARRSQTVHAQKRARAASETRRWVPGIQGRQKVVIRYTDGRVRRGFLAKGAAPQEATPGPPVVEDFGGKLVKVAPPEIKAIFFVKSFEGNRDYSEFKVYSSRPNGKGVWIRVHFKDGEVIEGVAANSFDTYSKEVFYMTPPDPGSNNQAVLVSKHSLKEMQVLGLATD